MSGLTPGAEKVKRFDTDDIEKNRRTQGEKVKDARLRKQAAATLRSRAAGSQDESRCSDIHKGNGVIQIRLQRSRRDAGATKDSSNGWRSEDRRYKINRNFNICAALKEILGGAGTRRETSVLCDGSDRARGLRSWVGLLLGFGLGAVFRRIQKFGDAQAAGGTDAFVPGDAVVGNASRNSINFLFEAPFCFGPGFVLALHFLLPFLECCRHYDLLKR
jgi:hypothetical protein